MKKFTFTVAQLLLLQEVRGTQGYKREKIIDLLQENEDPTIDVEVELSEEDIEDILGSIQQHIEGQEIGSIKFSVVNTILELLGVLPEEVAEESSEAAKETDSENHPDDYPGADVDGCFTLVINYYPVEGGVQISSFLDGRMSSFFQNLKYISISIKNYKL